MSNNLVYEIYTQLWGRPTPWDPTILLFTAPVAAWVRRLESNMQQKHEEPRRDGALVLLGLKAGDRSRTGDLQLGRHIARPPIPMESVGPTGIFIRFL